MTADMIKPDRFAAAGAPIEPTGPDNTARHAAAFMDLGPLIRDVERAAYGP